MGSARQQHNTSLPDKNPLDLTQLREALDQVFAGSPGDHDFYQCLAEFIAARFTGTGAVSIDRLNGEELKQSSAVLTDRGRRWSAELMSTLHAGAVRVASKQQVAIAKLAGQPEVVLIAVPVSAGVGKISHVLSIAIYLGDQSVEMYVALLQCIGACLSLHLQGSGRRLTASSSIGKFYQTVAVILENGSRKQGGALLADGLRELFQADVVMLVPARKNDRSQHLIHSGITGINRAAPQARSVQQIAAECRSKQKIFAWPNDGLGTDILPSLLLKELNQAQAVVQSICFPLINGVDAFCGTVIVAWSDRRCDATAVMDLYDQVKLLLANLTAWLSGSGNVVSSRLRSFFHKRKSLAGLLVLALLLAILFFPVSFSVQGNCVLVPKTTRFIVAQFDGLLKKIHKLPGQQVKKGELLAQLDERLIELEISALLAEMQKTAKKHDYHLASGEAAKAQMASLELQGLQETLGLYRERLHKLAIVSPVDGIVISENLQRIEGSPISRGQGLFEVAPLNLMIAEAHISQEDIGYVQLDADVTVSLDSFPQKKWQAEVATIFPRSELRNNRNVFLVEAELINDNKRLRPGMRGNMSVSAGKKSLAWRLFRKPWLYLQKTFLAD